MTYDELLEKIRVFLVSTELQSIDEDFLGNKKLRSLYAIVELHEPMAIKFPDYNPEAFCKKCKTEYPCPTIETIYEELV